MSFKRGDRVRKIADKQWVTVVVGEFEHKGQSGSVVEDCGTLWGLYNEQLYLGIQDYDFKSFEGAA